MESVPQDRATIAVKMLGKLYSGRWKIGILVDDQVVGVLKDARARSVLVHGGAHRVTARVGSVWTGSLEVSLKPGERVSLELGFKRASLPLDLGFMLGIGGGMVLSLLGYFPWAMVAQGIGIALAVANMVVVFFVPGASFYLRPSAVPVDADAELEAIDLPGADARAMTRRGFQLSLRALLILVACCAPLIWLGRELWERRPANQPARAIRMLGSADSGDRLSGATNIFLSIDRLTPEQIGELVLRLAVALRDQDPRVREASVEHLFSIVFDSTQRGAPVPHVATVGAALAEGLIDTVPKVRHHCGLSLANIYFGTPRTPNPSPPLPTDTARFVDLLCQALEDPSRDNREWASQVLGAIAPRLKELPPDRLLQALHASDPRTRAMVIRSVVEFPNGVDTYLPNLMEVLEHDVDPSVRSVCSMSLISVRPTVKSLALLRKALGSPDTRVRFRAADLMSYIGPQACDAVPAILPLLQETFEPKTKFERDHPDWNDPAVAACWALGRIAPGTAMADSARTSIREMLRGPGHPWRRRDAEWALGRIDAPAAPEKADSGAPSQ